MRLDHADSLQVLRYSALLFGLFYGFSHQTSIYANAKAAHAEHEYKHKEALIQKAKAEFAKKNLPPQSRTADGGGKSFGVVSWDLPLVAVQQLVRPEAPPADMLCHSYHQSG